MVAVCPQFGLVSAFTSVIKGLCHEVLDHSKLKCETHVIWFLCALLDLVPKEQKQFNWHMVYESWILFYML